MSKFWGPLGWMTLHSVSLNYPDTPTAEDQAIARTFLETFRDTITCPYCKTHFTTMLRDYSARVPNQYASRYEMVIFVIRAHNTVNRRLDKPKLETVHDAIATIQSNSKHVSLPTFRRNYLNYLAMNWGREFTGEAAIMRQKTMELKAINDRYWSLRESDGSDRTWEETDILTPIERPTALPARSPLVTIPRGRVGFRGGRLR
jgi:hypothetical protein